MARGLAPKAPLVTQACPLVRRNNAPVNVIQITRRDHRVGCSGEGYSRRKFLWKKA
jgi:hypothetical protein